MRLPALESLQDAEQFTVFQRCVYAAAADGLRFVDDASLQAARSGVTVTQERGAGRRIVRSIEVAVTPTAAERFPIWLSISPVDIILAFGGQHEEYGPERGERNETFAANVGAALRAAVGGRIKVVERRSNSQPYHWARLDLVDGQWRPGCSGGMLFFNYFGRKTTMELIWTGPPSPQQETARHA